MDNFKHFVPSREGINPTSHWLMTQEGAPLDTICGVLREIYLETRDTNISLLARIATTMAKKMDKKLREYHKKEQESDHIN